MERLSDGDTVKGLQFLINLILEGRSDAETVKGLQFLKEINSGETLRWRNCERDKILQNSNSGGLSDGETVKGSQFPQSLNSGSTLREFCFENVARIEI